MAIWRMFVSWHQPLPLPPLLLLLLLPAAWACMNTVLQKGTMADSELISPQLRVPSSCTCCALCHHHHDGCASLSFSSASGACRLYSSVPDFSRLTVDSESELFVRPGRSSTHQFCRDDSDCVEPGERCSGRVCTDDPTVTCRDLADTLGAPMNDVYYGSLSFTLMKYSCVSHSGIDGWTLVSRMTSGKGKWTFADLLERDRYQPTAASYSILRHANELSLAGAEARFKILVVFKKSGVERGFSGSLPMEQTLLPKEFTGPGSDVDLQDIVEFGDYRSANAILPWVQPNAAALLSVKGPQWTYYYSTLINTHGNVYLVEHVVWTTAEYYVRD